MALRIYSLDGSQVLTTIWKRMLLNLSIEDEIESRLKIPKEYQLFFSVGRKFIPSEQCWTGRYPKFINIGVRGGFSGELGGVNTDRDLYCDLVSKVHIKNKVNGSHSIESFNSTFSSTYQDLKLYIENCYKIPIQAQTIFRENHGHYFEPGEDSFIVDYLYDCEVVPENIVYLTMKEIDEFRFSDLLNNLPTANIINHFGKLKPISIVSKLGKDDKVTKLMTILPDQVFNPINGMKSKIKDRLNIPEHCQVLFFDSQDCKLVKGELHVELLPNLFEYLFEMEENEREIYLSVECVEKMKGQSKYTGLSEDSQTIAICREYNIKVIEVMLTAPDGSIIDFVPIGRNFTVYDLKRLIEKRHRLPVASQLLYGTGFRYLSNDMSLWVYFHKNRLLVENCPACIVLTADKLNQRVDETSRQLQIPKVSSEIIIKTLNHKKEILKIPLQKVNKENLWYRSLMSELEMNLRIPPAAMVLCFNKDTNINYIRTLPIENLFFFGGVFTENIVFELTFKTSQFDGVADYCDKFAISRLTQLEIKLLTSLIVVNVLYEDIITISDVKEYVEKTKNIPTILQELTCNGRILSDGESILIIYIQESSNHDSDLSINLIIKPAKPITVELLSPYLSLPDQLMSESDTILALKTKIFRDYGIPAELMKISGTFNTSSQKELDDGFFLYKPCSNGITRVHVCKLLNVQLTFSNGNVVMEKHSIYDGNNNTRDVLSLYPLFKVDKKCPMKKDTLLKDLDVDFVIKLKEVDKTFASCVVM